MKTKLSNKLSLAIVEDIVGLWSPLPSYAPDTLVEQKGNYMSTKADITDFPPTELNDMEETIYPSH